MRQRVGLARALAVDADVLLMDEPFSAVDEQTRRKFQEDLLRLVDVERKTFIFVTHSIEEAVYVSDRVVLLSSRPGRVWREIETRLGTHRRSRRDPAQPALSRYGRRDLAAAQAVCRLGRRHAGHRAPLSDDDLAPGLGAGVGAGREAGADPAAAALHLGPGCDGRGGDDGHASPGRPWTRSWRSWPAWGSPSRPGCRSAS